MGSKSKEAKKRNCPQCGERAELRRCYCEKTVCEACFMGILHDLCLFAWKPRPFKRCKKRTAGERTVAKIMQMQIKADRIARVFRKKRFEGDLAGFLLAADGMGRNAVSLDQGGRDY